MTTLVTIYYIVSLVAAVMQIMVCYKELSQHEA